ncbi:MAG TPA: methyl-accepting chemotaxis protein [Chloroflexota bacterium]|nr:methyl-accepting chemotaxis protein [Chloroflexota bacterium]
MKPLRDLALRWKLLAAFALVLAIVVALNAYVYQRSINTLQARAAVERSRQAIASSSDLLEALLNMETGYRGFLITGVDEFLEPYNQGRQEYQTALERVKQAAADDPEQLRRWQDVDQRVAAWQREVLDPGIQLRRDVNQGTSTYDSVIRFEALGVGKRYFDGLRAVIRDAQSAESALLQQRDARETEASERLHWVIVGGTLAAVLAGALVAIGLARWLAGAMGRLGRAAAGIAAGDVDQRIDLRSKDEIGQLADSFRAMVAYLRRMASVANSIAQGDLTREVQPQSAHDALGVAFASMVTNLRELTGALQAAARDLASASNEIRVAVSQQTSGAAEQSAAITQTTATVDEVKASADQASGLAVVVSDTAQQANRVAADGVEAVANATAGMGTIREQVQSIADDILALSEQSQQIGDIITTVGDLADQSNLLALNAAIEAARAGEHGKGFAVVAAEIRALAEQSKAATAQVRTLLSDIQRATNAAVLATEQGTSGVDHGVQLTAQTGRTIDELARVIQDTARSAQQIAAAVRQHSVGMEQIAAAMANINQVTSQSLAATTNTQQAAEHLSDLAARLDGLVARYQV